MDFLSVWNNQCKNLWPYNFVVNLCCFNLWLDFEKPTKSTSWAYSILLLQLIAILMAYPCAVPLLRLVNWYFCRTNFADHVRSWLTQWASWKAWNGKYRLEINPNVSETSFRLSRFVRDYSWTHNYSKPCIHGLKLVLTWLKMPVTQQATSWVVSHVKLIYLLITVIFQHLLVTQLLQALVSFKLSHF